MPLTHAAPFGKLRQILSNGALLSQLHLGIAPGRAETTMDTTDDVFLYAAAFSYPDTECGFLFVHSLEQVRGDQSVATPFDSGALATKLSPPAAYANGVSFVRDHELPVSDYRSLLGAVITGYAQSADRYLESPEDFACFCGNALAHPFGLAGGDRRAATFELRIPQRVELSPPHLLAVFVREGFEIPELAPLHSAGIRIVRYEAPDGDDFFHAMRLSCISFVRQLLAP